MRNHWHRMMKNLRRVISKVKAVMYIQHNPTLLLVTVINAFCFLSTAGAQSQSEEKTLLAVLNADSPLGLQNAFKELLSLADETRLSELKRNEHNGIAIQAAWEQLYREAMGRDEKELDGSLVDPFLKFVEKRIGTDIPDWWRKIVLNAKISENSFQFPVETYRPYKTTKSGCFAPEEVAAEFIGSKLTITVNGTAFFVEDISLEELSEMSMKPSIVATANKGFQYVAFHPSQRNVFDVHTVDSDSGKRTCLAHVWTGQVVFFWRATFLPGERVGSHAVSIVPGNDEQFLIFGSDGFSIYLEVFEKNGDNVMRFSSTYSGS